MNIMLTVAGKPVTSRAEAFLRAAIAGDAMAGGIDPATAVHAAAGVVIPGDWNWAAQATEDDGTLLWEGRYREAAVTSASIAGDGEQADGDAAEGLRSVLYEIIRISRDEAAIALASRALEGHPFGGAVAQMQQSLRDQVAENARLAAENVKLAEGGRVLSQTLDVYVRSMYALWIDAQRGDLTASNPIFEALDGFDGPEWNGTETGFEWLERTRGEPDDDAGTIADGLFTLSPEELRDVLLLIGEDVPAEAIAGWTDGQREGVARYAAAEHLHASDNDDVERLPRPAVLRALPDGTPAWSLPVPGEPDGASQ